MSVKAVYFNVQDVGKHMKKSKKRFIWKFQVDGQEHVLEMFVSYLSNKKQILLNGRSIYEAQKMTSSFQFPFQVDKSSCIIVQHGDQFELRINNQVFSHLYNRERMKREFQFVDEDNVRKHSGDLDDFGRKEEKPYKQRPDITMDAYEHSAPKHESGSYYSSQQRSTQSRPKGAWDDVKKAQESVRKEQPKASFKPKNDDDEDGGLGFSSAFDKFDYKSTSSTTQKKSTSDPFDGFDNKYSGDTKGSKSTQQKELSAFDAFDSKPAQKQSVSAFDAFETKPAQKDSFASFEQFGGFSEKPAQKKPAQNDLLDLDFGGGSTTQQTQPTNQTANTGFDFFGGGSAPTQNQTTNQGGFDAFGTQPTQQANTNNFNDAFGDFSGTGTTANTTTVTTPANNQANQNQAPPAQDNKKKDLWDTDLVSLSASDAFTNNNTQPQNDFGYGMGGNTMNFGMNTNMGMGNMGMGMNMNMNTNAGYGNSSFGMNQGGFGGNTNFAGNNFGTNQNFAGNGFGTNQNFGGNTMGQSNFQTQQQNFGGMNQGFGGNVGMSTMNMNQDYNQNTGFGMQMNYQQPVAMVATTADDEATPFD